MHIKCSDCTLRDWGHGGRVGFGSVSPTIGVLVAVGNKLGNRDEILIAAAFILIVGQQLIINAVPVSNLLTSIFF